MFLFLFLLFLFFISWLCLLLFPGSPLGDQARSRTSAPRGRQLLHAHRGDGGGGGELSQTHPQSGNSGGNLVLFHKLTLLINTCPDIQEQQTLYSLNLKLLGLLIIDTTILLVFLRVIETQYILEIS